MPVLTAVGHCNQPCFFNFVCSSKELIPCFRSAADAGFLQHSRIGPHPVHTVNVDRGSHIVALVFHDIGNHAWEQAVPFFCFGSGIEIGEYTFSGPLLNRRSFDLGCCRWVSRHDAAFEHRGCIVTATACNGKIFPSVALGLHDFLEFSHGFGFATGSPVMQYLDFTCHGRARRDHQSHRSSQLRKLQHHVSSTFIAAKCPQDRVKSVLTPRQHEFINYSLIN